MKWSENDELFKKELEQGYKWQLRVAEYMRKCGLSAEIPELTFRENIKEASKYSDLEDIICNGKVIEVKSRKLRFTSPKDFPFDTMLVDTVSGWESKERKPDAYVCVSTITGAMIALSAATHPRWKKVKRYDATRQITDWFYECHKSEWHSINSMIRKLSQLS